MAEEAKTDIVSLLIEDRRFSVPKDLLCEHSDYFRAMFSGNFSEKEKPEITIDVVDANSMQIIIKYMEMGLIDLLEFSISTIGEIAVASNFLQITELLKQIEHHLELQLSLPNWMEIMALAHNVPFPKLEQRSAAFGLYQFKSMKSEYIKGPDKLVWYLSHSHLHAESELDVFRFGRDWALLNRREPETMHLVIASMDLSRASRKDMIKIKSLSHLTVAALSLQEKVIRCLCEHSLYNFKMTVTGLETNKGPLCRRYSEEVYEEVLKLVTNSVKREFPMTPCVGLWDRTLVDEVKDKIPEKKARTNTNFLYKYKDENLTQWLEVTNKELWGWSVVAWGPTKIVIVGGEHGKGTGYFWNGLRVYDTITKEWTDHGHGLPCRRHTGVTIIKDSLYIIGGVGGYRILMDQAGIYDLKEQSYRSIAKFPDAIQSPAVCAFQNKVYAAGHTSIYYYEDDGEYDQWHKILEPHLRLSCMVSYNEYIYCTQNYFNNFYRFVPRRDETLTLVKCLSHSPTVMCNMGNKLMIFASSNTTQEDTVTVGEYTEQDGDDKHTVVFSKDNCPFTINEAAGACAVINELPPLNYELSKYFKDWLVHYEAAYIARNANSRVAFLNLFEASAFLCKKEQ